ncbi:MAG TPA: hemolysin family protein [Bryobacteraceae bacterium]|nr:hemolysin family protein [Bryobacteraceae bacterium]
MTWFALGATIVWAVLLCLITVVQILYMESLRLRSRDLPALEYFKTSIQDRLGVSGDDGVLAFSVIKHTLILLLGVCFLAISGNDSAHGWQNLLEAAIFSWLIMLVATYILAQLLYRKTSGHWLRPFTPILRLCILLAKPLTGMLGFFQSLVELSEPAKPNEEGPGPSGDIEALISAGEEEGLIEKGDRKLIESVVAFGDKTVREVMTPRPKLVAIEANRSLEDLRELVIHEQYSRIPVFERTIDNITGFVHVRDMFELDEAARKGRRVKELARPIRLVPETKPVNDLLREMQADGAHMAIVIDEYGNTAGLATMEDLVEEILGEIHDEHEPERDALKEPDGSFVVAGSLDLDRLHDLLEFRKPEGTESTTVGGLVTEWLGHVPHVGEVIEREGIRLEVLAGDELKVEQVRVSKSLQQTVEPQTVPDVTL